MTRSQGAFVEFNDVLRTRRSVRHFRPEVPVHDGQIREILNAGTEAPSAGNIQPWRFTVIRSHEVKERLVESVASKWILNAPAIIIVSMDSRVSYARYGVRGEDLYAIQDTAAAVENMLLKAVDLGLGACWIGAFDPDAVRQSISLKPGYTPVAIIPLGTSAESAGKPSRRNIDELTTWM